MHARTVLIRLMTSRDSDIWCQIVPLQKTCFILHGLKTWHLSPIFLTGATPPLLLAERWGALPHTAHNLLTESPGPDCCRAEKGDSGKASLLLSPSRDCYLPQLGTGQLPTFFTTGGNSGANVTFTCVLPITGRTTIPTSLVPRLAPAFFQISGAFQRACPRTRHQGRRKTGSKLRGPPSSAHIRVPRTSMGSCSSLSALLCL
jgi:hypothetical protein